MPYQRNTVAYRGHCTFYFIAIHRVILRFYRAIKMYLKSG